MSLKKQSILGCSWLTRNRLDPNINRAKKAGHLKRIDQVALPINPEDRLLRACAQDVTGQSEPLAIARDPRQKRRALQLSLENENLRSIWCPVL